MKQVADGEMSGTGEKASGLALATLLGVVITELGFKR